MFLKNYVKKYIIIINIIYIKGMIVRLINELKFVIVEQSGKQLL